MIEEVGRLNVDIGVADDGRISRLREDIETAIELNDVLLLLSISDQTSIKRTVLASQPRTVGH